MHTNPARSRARGVGGVWWSLQLGDLYGLNGLNGLNSSTIGRASVASGGGLDVVHVGSAASMREANSNRNFNSVELRGPLCLSQPSGRELTCLDVLCTLCLGSSKGLANLLHVHSFAVMVNWVCWASWPS
jgi:hypothetical protein